MAILSITKMVAPMLWGHIVDHTGRRMPMIRLGALFSVLGFTSVFAADGFASMALAMLLFSFFWNASLPQMEAVTFNHLRERPTRYALVRLWGSVGFILVVTALGLRLEHDSLAVVPIWILILTVGICLSAFLIPDSAPESSDRVVASIRSLLRRPSVLAFFGACFLMQLSHGIYYAFYSIHLTTAGYSSAAVGWLWALGVVAEVLVFLVMHQLLGALRRASRPALESGARRGALDGDRRLRRDPGGPDPGADTARGDLRILSCLGDSSRPPRLSRADARAWAGALQQSELWGRRRGRKPDRRPLVGWIRAIADLRGRCFGGGVGALRRLALDER